MNSDDVRKDAYRVAAKRLHHKEGTIEVDDAAPVSIGDDDGAYVQAWVWVSNEDRDRKVVCLSPATCPRPRTGTEHLCGPCRQDAGL
jgi:hypothetical protein